jgi:dTDP-4-amino-4,6-dideoxygalactose transaminase
MLDLSSQFQELEAEWLAAIRETGGRGSFILGPNVTAFEQEAAAYMGVKHAIGVANGTDALLLSLRAEGVGPGDEVITTPWTFFATAEVISMVGATPVFVDIDEDSFNIDARRIEERISDRTRAVMPVHIFGYPAQMTAISAVAEEHGLAVIEDCAQAFGAMHDGGRVGSFGSTGCYSFYPTKVLGGYGDGGMITTNSPEIDARVRQLRNHGATAPFMHDTIGYNSRLDEIQAALLRIKLRGIDAILDGRQRVADVYDKGLAGLDLQVPARPADGRHAFNLYTIRSPHRDRIRDALKEAKIGFSVCYPLPLHLQAVYRDLGYRHGDLPVCERLSDEVISLPIFPEMREEQVARVCEVVAAAVGGG